MNAYPIRLAAGLVLLALCAMADDEKSPAATAAEAQTNPTVAGKMHVFAIGLNDEPIQLPTQIVKGAPPHQLYQDLKVAARRQQMSASRSLYQTNLLDKIQ